MDRLNLLVIDDDPNIRNLLTDLLRGRPDLNLLIAASGPEAVQHFATKRIDLVLTDIHMPGFTGLELMDDMKKINFKPEILVMTANATPENVEIARRLGARSVILKPFDDLEVIEAEINKAANATRAARGQAVRSAPAPLHVAAPSPSAARVPLVAGITPPSAPAGPAPPARHVPGVPVSAFALPAEPKGQSVAQALPDFDDWKAELTGNETPTVSRAPAKAARPPTPPLSSLPAHAAPPVPSAHGAPSLPQTAPPAHASPAGQASSPAGHGKPVAQHASEAPAGAPPPAVHEADEEAGPDIPVELDDIVRAATRLDAGRMRMQVPIVCLQTWEEKGAVATLRRVAAALGREFYLWSAARGLLKDGGQPMGDMYREATRALEFIRRQKNNGLYILADFRPFLDDRMVVRALREMVMESETARALLVLTAPRLPLPPELAQVGVTFDWPAGGSTDVEALYDEVAAEIAATADRAAVLALPERNALLKRVKELPAGRARFEIARALMGRTK